MNDILMQRAKALGLEGLIHQWTDFEAHQSLLLKLFEAEEHFRAEKDCKRRLENSGLKLFRPMADFNWKWPNEIDRQTVEQLFTFEFLKDALGAVFIGPNGVGKTMIAKNLVHQAVLRGHKALFVNAATLLADLSSATDTRSLRKRMRKYETPALLAIDELGYLSYANHHSDLLYQVLESRYERKSTLITTNRPFTQWGEMFPNAATVVTLVDRIVHKSEIIKIEARSYRLHEAEERQRKKKIPSKIPL